MHYYATQQQVTWRHTLGMVKFRNTSHYRGVVVVEMDNNHLVEFDAKEVYINAESVRN